MAPKYFVRLFSLLKYRQLKVYAPVYYKFENFYSGPAYRTYSQPENFWIFYFIVIQNVPSIFWTLMTDCATI